MLDKDSPVFDDFKSALSSHKTILRTPLAADGYIEDELSEIAKALEGLDNYEQFIEAARTQKSSLRRTSAAFESLVLERAERASRDCEAVVDRILRVHRHYFLSGYVQAGLAALNDTRDSKPAVNMGDLFEFLRNVDSFKQLVGEVPLRADLVDRVFDTVASSLASQELAVVDGFAEIRATGSQERRVRLPGTPPKAGIDQLLRGHPLASYGTRQWRGRALEGAIDLNEPPDEEGGAPYALEVEDLLLAIPVNAQVEMRRHLSRIKEGGLPAYEGREGALVLAGILLAMAAIIWLVKKLCEDHGGDDCAESVLFVLLLVLIYLSPGDVQYGVTPSTNTYANPRSM